MAGERESEGLSEPSAEGEMEAVREGLREVEKVGELVPVRDVLLDTVPVALPPPPPPPPPARARVALMVVDRVGEAWAEAV